MTSSFSQRENLPLTTSHVEESECDEMCSIKDSASPENPNLAHTQQEAEADAKLEGELQLNPKFRKLNCELRSGPTKLQPSSGQTQESFWMSAPETSTPKCSQVVNEPGAQANVSGSRSKNRGALFALKFVHFVKQDRSISGSKVSQLQKKCLFRKMPQRDIRDVHNECNLDFEWKVESKKTKRVTSKE